MVVLSEVIGGAVLVTLLILGILKAAETMRRRRGRQEGPE